MDRYELNIKIEQIKKLARQKDYAAAAKVADSIDFYRVKDNKTLSLLADVYEASGKYEQAKEILIEAYARTSLGRRLAYRLVKLCIKSGNIREAEEFYQDFTEAAPRDNSKYILQYQLATAKGEPMEKRIDILETYLGDEMDEKWSFELAKLYHKAGQKDKCIKQCDDLILWFNDGKYVDRAMELKMIYTPLSKTQQVKYEERWMAKAPSGIKVEDIKVKEFDAANRYNTVNIQNALRESMDILMNEDDENQDGENTDNQTELEKTKVVFTDRVVNDLLSRTITDMKIPESRYNTVPLSPMLDMDSHGQIEMSIDEPVDDQIEGQMTIEELLEEYVKREAENEEMAEEKPSEEENGEDIMSVTSELSVIESALVEAATAMVQDENRDDEGEAVLETEDMPEETAEPEYDLEEEPVEASETDLEEQSEEDREEKGDSPENTEKAVDNQVVKELIKEFVVKYSGVQGLDRQLLMVLQESLINGNAHIIVMGEVKSGKTALAIDLVKIVNKIRQVRGRKIAKINGEVLNGKNIADYFERLSGMDIIIEKAGSLSTASVNEIMEEIRKDSENKIIVMEDEKNSAESLISSNNELGEMFKSQVIVKQNKIRDWAVVAKEYAGEKGYEIDEMGMLALHAKIDALYAISLIINKAQVESIIDEAILSSGKKGFGRIFKRFGKEKEKILKEEDFV